VAEAEGFRGLTAPLWPIRYKPLPDELLSSWLVRLAHGHDVLLGDDARGFADAVLQLYGDEHLWTQLSDAGLDNVRGHFSFEAARAVLERALAT